MDTSTLGTRIKGYEKAYDQIIIGRLPVICRIDGKKFSKYTKKFKATKPFDDDFSNAMAQAMLYTASHIEGCVFAYGQSDEMTFVLRNDQSLESVPWFGNRVQKICSVVASMVSSAFNAELRKIDRWKDFEQLAHFDTRVFAVPTITEATNAIWWRMNDCVKNSILCACYYEVANVVGRKTARKFMHGLNQNQQQELLFQKAGINWNDYPAKFKCGMSCKRVLHTFERDGQTFTRSKWEIDYEMPRDREYIIKALEFDDGKDE